MIYDDIVTENALRERIIAELDGTYDLVHVDYRDQLNDDQVGMLVAGDHEDLWESTFEFESEWRHHGVQYVIDDIRSRLSDDERRAFDAIDEDIRDIIRDRDTSRWFDQLVRQTPDPILRLPAIGEDFATLLDSDEPDWAEVFAELGVPDTAGNREVIQRLVRETPSSVLMGYWLVTLDLSFINKLADDDDVLIVSPTLILGNPFTGAYTCDESRLEGAIVVKRGDLRTDRQAFGYSAAEVYGGLDASRYECDARVVAPVEV